MKTVLALLLCASGLLAETPSAIAIRNAKVVPVSGPVLQKGTVVLKNGLIEAVGENAAIPADAWVIDGEGLTVYPGLVDGLSTIGLPGFGPATPAAAAGRGGGGGGQRQAAAQTTTPAPFARGPEDRPQTSSWLRAADQIDASDRRIETARNSGYTSSVTFPTRGIFAGQGAVIALAGNERAGSMVIAAPVGQYVSTQPTGGFGGGFPNALFGVISYIRQIYLDADQYQKAKAMYAADPRGMARPPYDRALEGVIESPRILMPGRHFVEIDRNILLAKEFKQSLVLYGGHDGYRAADLLKQGGTTVLVSLKWPERARDADPDENQTMKEITLRDKAPSTPAVLAKAGVKFAFYTDGVEGRANVYKAVRKAIENGLSFDAALKAMTLSPAEIFGVSDRLGSIEKGKIANIIVTKGDLFQDKTEVKYIFVDGVKYEPAPEEPPAGAGGRPGGAPTTPNDNQGGNQ